jgi:subtilisin-like proprotein convertase family protein
MKKSRLLVLVVGVSCVGALTVTASAQASTFTCSAPITIPDSGAATPYPSTINVAGIPANVGDLNVTLTGLSHTCMADLRFLLVGPGGQKTILLSTAGPRCTPDVAGANITLDDEASASYPCNAGPSGSFKPTPESTTGGACSGPPVSPVPFPAPAPAAPYPVALSAFDGAASTGTWSLFVFDQYSSDLGSLAGWSLDLLPSVSCAGKAASVRANVGTAGNDKLVGTPGPDVMVGLGGNDTIHGLGGNDVICGGAGNDKLFGGPGKDLLRGEAGRDKLKGQGGKDTCIGGSKPDTAKSCEKQKSI